MEYSSEDVEFYCSGGETVFFIVRGKAFLARCPENLTDKGSGGRRSFIKPHFSVVVGKETASICWTRQSDQRKAVVHIDLTSGKEIRDDQLLAS